MKAGLEYVLNMINGIVPPPPSSKFLGYSISDVSDMHVEIAFTADVNIHANPMGTLHGGVLSAIADTAMGLAYATTLDEDETFTTIELKINYLKPVWNSTLCAVGKVVKRGQMIGLLECDIFDERNKLVARASSTGMALQGKKARGR
ncbi:PaaI family thioesterase [Ectobacillus panaciterrae]|uniref:PaaI family thioesterase n=1 Tax=Ectobacillus panaciterrae TaxID=363872 RepID=UPI0004118FD3|nr:PaaI family thioesterase [Ectobacillus panaciterrae]